MTANRIIHHIFNQPDLRHVDQSALEKLVDTYPYFAAARVLLAQKQFSYIPDFNTPIFKKAQLYTSTPHYLYQLTTSEPEKAAAVTTVETPEETVQNITPAPEERQPAAEYTAERSENILPAETMEEDVVTEEISLTQRLADDEEPDTIVDASDTADISLTQTLADEPVEEVPAVSAEEAVAEYAAQEIEEEDDINAAFTGEETDEPDEETISEVITADEPEVPAETPEEAVTEYAEQEKEEEDDINEAFTGDDDAEDSPVTDFAEDNSVDQPITKGLATDFEPGTISTEDEYESTLKAAEKVADTSDETLEDAISAEDQAILDELEAEDKAAADAREAAALAGSDAPVESIAPIQEEVVPADYEAMKAVAEFDQARNTVEDEVVAIDYEAEQAIAALEEARNSTEDEVVAIDYETEEAVAALEEARNSTEDEVVAIDYEEVALEEARNSTEDEVVAIDYDFLKEEARMEYDAEPEGEEIIVEAETEPTGDGLTIPPATDGPLETVVAEEEPAMIQGEVKEEYFAEPEEEEIVIAAETEPTGDGLAIPPAPGAASETASPGPEPETADIAAETAVAAQAAANSGTAAIETGAPDEVEEKQPEETGPIRIQPLSAVEETTELTFQPLYTDDYFAYKKLKDPNTAEMMTDKAAAEMRSFTDWLREIKDNFSGKAAKDWYHQQLHKLYEDDDPEVTERVEKMAMQSITLNDDIVSETLAEIWVRQHQPEKAIAIYQKLSLLNPGKNAYFAQKIKELQLLSE